MRQDVYKRQGYGVPSNEQSEPSNLYENTGNLVNQYGGYYTNPDTYRIIKVYASDSDVYKRQLQDRDCL